MNHKRIPQEVSQTLIATLLAAKTTLQKALESEEAKALPANEKVFSISPIAVALHTNEQGLDLCKQLDIARAREAGHVLENSLEATLTELIKAELPPGVHRCVIILPEIDFFDAFEVDFDTMELHMEHDTMVPTTIPELLRTPPPAGRKRTAAEITTLIETIVTTARRGLFEVAMMLKEDKAPKDVTIALFAMEPPRAWEIHVIKADALPEMGREIDKLNDGKSDAEGTIKQFLADPIPDDCVRVAIWCPFQKFFSTAALGYTILDGEHPTAPKVVVSMTPGAGGMPPTPHSIN